MSTPNAFAWVKKVEAEYGQPIDQILQQAADAAPVTGYTMADLAREWGIKRNALYYYCTEKLGIRFPRGASATQKSKAAESGRNTGIARCQHWVTVNGERRTLRSECARIGRDYSTVRLLMDKHGVSAETAIQMPSVPRVERYRGVRSMTRTKSEHWATAVEAEYGQPIEDIIRAEVESGHSSQKEMCEDFKCTRGQLQYLCRKLGVSLSAKTLSDEQKRAKAEAGRKSRAIRRDALMATLNGEKVTLRHAAAMVGVCYETARRNVKRYGITPDEALKIPPMTPHEYGKKAARARWGVA